MRNTKIAFNCSPELATKLLELRHDRNYPAQTFARRLIRQAMEFREVGKVEALDLIRWTYSWL